MAGLAPEHDCCFELIMALPDSFDTWLRRRNVRQFGVEVRVFTDGVRGVAATELLQPGRKVLQVPESCLFTREAADDLFKSALLKVNDDLTPLQILASLCIYERSKGHASKWSPYLQQLPRSYTSFLSWRQRDIAALQEEHAMQEASEACKALLAEFPIVNTFLGLLKVPSLWHSLTVWQWAASTVASRTMYLPNDAAGCLTPFGDMHNYKPPPPPELPEISGVTAGTIGGGEISGDGHFDVETRSYCIHTRCAVQPGDQVFLCYGVYTNLELLEHYGFQLEDNPHDTAILPRAIVQRVLGEKAAEELPLEAAALHPCGIPKWSLLQALRLSAADPSDRRRSGHRAAAGQPITPAAEVAAMEQLHRLCSEALALLPTTLQSDEARLHAATAGSQECLCLAIKWRISHKRILRMGMQVATSATEHLMNSEQYHEL